jgi:hypothetical protein
MLISGGLLLVFAARVPEEISECAEALAQKKSLI